MTLHTILLSLGVVRDIMRSFVFHFALMILFHGSVFGADFLYIFYFHLLGKNREYIYHPVRVYSSFNLTFNYLFSSIVLLPNKEIKGTV